MRNKRLTNEKKSLYRNRVLSSLYVSNQLTRSQVTMGPLVHVGKRLRDQVLKALATEGLIKADQIKGPMGAPATVYRITASGRKHCRETLNDGDGRSERAKILGRDSGAGNRPSEPWIKRTQ